MLKENAGHHHYKVTISMIVLSIFLLSKCMTTDDKTNDAGSNSSFAAIAEQAVNIPGYEQYAGSLTCTKCHKDICSDFVHTAHHLTSQPASKKYILGSFIKGKNTFAFSNGEVVAMEEKKDSFYQVLYEHGLEQKREPIDIVVGSGTMGQSFLYWKNNSLFQLPITYFTAAAEWSNSPGFPDKAVYNRDITVRCLECHSTFVKAFSAAGRQPDEFSHQQILYGVDCEKCHGPAARHVAFQLQHPADTTGKFITNPAKLSRQQNLDVCALCHGGRLQKTKPSFSFAAGDTLTRFFKIDTEIPNPNSVDVHGNQYGLLRSSKCFRMSNTMTCNTCHNTHRNEKGKTALFSQRCMTCHTAAHGNFCTLTDSLGSVIKTNCIDCHMPLNPSRAIAVYLPGKDAPTAALVRSHYIQIYPGETKKVIAYMKKLSGNK